MNTSNNSHKDLTLNKADAVEFLNIVATFFLFQFFILRLIVKFLETPDISPILIGRAILGFILAILIIIMAFSMKGKKSNKLNITQLLCAFVFLILPSNCIIDSALDKNPMIILPVLIVLFAMAVILTNIAHMKADRNI